MIILSWLCLSCVMVFLGSGHACNMGHSYPAVLIGFQRCNEILSFSSATKKGDRQFYPHLMKSELLNCGKSFSRLELGDAHLRSRGRPIKKFNTSHLRSPTEIQFSIPMSIPMPTPLSIPISCVTPISILFKYQYQYQ